MAIRIIRHEAVPNRQLRGSVRGCRPSRFYYFDESWRGGCGRKF